MMHILFRILCSCRWLHDGVCSVHCFLQLKAVNKRWCISSYLLIPYFKLLLVVTRWCISSYLLVPQFILLLFVTRWCIFCSLFYIYLQVVTRWWGMFCSLPFPDRIALKLVREETNTSFFIYICTYNLILPPPIQI